MKDLKLKENEVVHCKTEKQAKKVLKIAHKCGLKWISGEKYSKVNKWDLYEKDTVYYMRKGEFGDIDELSNEYNIITSKEFLKRHKKDNNELKNLTKIVEKLELIVKEVDINEVEPCKDSVIKGPILHVTEIPKVGDVVKAWDTGEKESRYIYGVFEGRDSDSPYPYTVGGTGYSSIEKAPEEIIKYFK